MILAKRAALDREDVGPRGKSLVLAGVARSLSRSPIGLVGAGITGMVIVCAVLAPAIAPQDPTKLNFGARLMPPAWSPGGSWSFPLGTDQLGRDILSRILYGARISVVVGITAVVMAGAVGVLIGLASGYFGGWVDTLLSRVIDTFLGLPFIVLALAIVGVLGPGLVNLILVLGIAGWVTYARVVRGEVLSAKEEEYVVAARVAGQREWRIAVRHVLPNVVAPVVVLLALNVGTTIIAESALSYLGLGVQPPTVTWGGMLADGREYLTSSWWLATFPGVAITATVLGVTFLGDWLRDVLDPRLRR